ncbi:unnamed protein product [Urochloa humidicola]
MEWPMRCGKFTIVALLIILLASTGGASSATARRAGIIADGVPASDAGDSKAAYLMAALHASVSHGDATIDQLPKCADVSG